MSKINFEDIEVHVPKDKDLPERGRGPIREELDKSFQLTEVVEKSLTVLAQMVEPVLNPASQVTGRVVDEDVPATSTILSLLMDLNVRLKRHIDEIQILQNRIEL